MTVFPPIDSAYILSFQFSAWYPKFARNSIKSTIIHPLKEDFVNYLNADGVIIPEGSGLEEETSGITEEDTSVATVILKAPK